MLLAAIEASQLQHATLATMAVEINRGLALALRLWRPKGREPSAYRANRKLAVKCGLALQVARSAEETLSANSITPDYPAFRHINSLGSVVTHSGTAEIHSPIIGDALTGHKVSMTALLAQVQQ